MHLYLFRSLPLVEMKNVSQGKLGHPQLSTFCRPGEQQADHETAMDPHDKKGQHYPRLNEEKLSAG